MQYLIELLLNAAEDVTMPDNTRGKAIQCQITLVGKELSGALTRVPNVEGVYKLLSVGQTPDKQAVLVEVYVDPNAIQALSRIMPKPLIEVAAPH